MWAGANAIKREREKRASRCGAGVIFQEYFEKSPKAVTK